MHVIIMCKAPVAGRVKTRLMSDYSAEEAAAIHAAMATTVIERVRRLFADVWLSVDDMGHDFFRKLELPMLQQRPEGDLGQRMSAALEAVFMKGAESVMLLGTDSPHMADGRLLAAARALDTHDVVLGPVEDGGYDLIAMRKPYLKLFQDIAWSSEQVMAQTCSVARQLGLSLHQLPESFDVDTPATLQRALQGGWCVPERFIERPRL